MSGDPLRNSPETGMNGPTSDGAAFDFDTFRAVLDANINRNSLLATDYLNHFSEVVMQIGPVTDMPECLEKARGWAPKTYQAHFVDSGLS